MKKQEEIQLMEKGDKLYVIATEEGKRKAHEYFKDIEGIIKLEKKMSATEFIRQLRKETSIIPKKQIIAIKQRA